MKLIVTRDALHTSLQSVAKIVSARNTIPILANVWLGAEGETLKLRATDLDIEAEASLDARVSNHGSTTVNASALRDIVAKTPSGAEISLEVLDGQLTFKAGRSRFKMNALPSEDFPNLDAVKPTYEFDIDASDFERLLDKSAFAASIDGTRYYLNGIFFHPVHGRARSVATNGHTLALIDGPEVASSEKMPSVIIPRKAVSELSRLGQKSGASIHVAMNDSKIAVTFPSGVRLTSKLIDGTFPDYARITPTNNNISATVNRAALVSAVERVIALIGSGHGGIALKISFVDSVAVLEIANTEAGSSRDEIDADYDGAPLSIGINPRYLLDILGVMTGDRVQFKLCDPGSPIVMCDLGDMDCLFVVMPLRIL